MKTTSFNSLVYMKEKNYVQEKKNFDLKTREKCVEPVCFHTSSEDFISQYSALAEWMSMCLGFIREDLFLIFFMLYCRIYFLLLESHDTQLALRFSYSFASMFKTRYQAQLAEVGKVCTPQHLKESVLFCTFCNKSIQVEIHQYSFDMLTRFLLENDMNSVIEILNNHFTIEISNEKVATPSRKLMKTKVVEEKLAYNCEMKSLKFEHYNLSEHSILGKPQTEHLSCVEYDNVWPTVSSIGLRSAVLRCADISANCKLIAYGFEDGSVQIACMEDATPVEKRHDFDAFRSYFSKVYSHSGPVLDLRFCHDGTFLTSSVDGVCRLWAFCDHNSPYQDPCWENIANFKPSRCRLPSWNIKTAPFSDMFVTTSNNDVAYTWAMCRNDPIRMLCHDSPLTCCTWHPNGQYISTGTKNGITYIWDLRCSQACVTFKGPRNVLNGFSLGIQPTALCHDKKYGNYFAIGDDDGSIFLHDLRMHGKQFIDSAKSNIKDSVSSLEFSGNSKWLSVGLRSNTLMVYNASYLGLNREKKGGYSGIDVEDFESKIFHNPLYSIYCVKFHEYDCLPSSSIPHDTIHTTGIILDGKNNNKGHNPVR